METTTTNDYQVVRDFLTELETKRPKDIGDFPTEKVKEFWSALFRVWPAEVERLNWKAEMATSFVLGVLVTLFLLYLYNSVSETAPDLTPMLPRGTV